MNTKTLLLPSLRRSIAVGKPYGGGLLLAATRRYEFHTTTKTDASLQATENNPLLLDNIPFDSIRSTKTTTDLNGLTNKEVAKIFKNQTTFDLFKAFVVLGSCRIKMLSQHATGLLKLVDMLGPLATPFYWFVGKTVFSHFCGGQAVNDLKLHQTIRKLHKNGISALLDYSVEAESASSSTDCLNQYEHAKDIIKQTIQLSAEINQRNNTQTNSTAAFSCLKVTALGPSEVLLRLSQLLTAQPDLRVNLGLANTVDNHSSECIEEPETPPSFKLRTPTFNLDSLGVPEPLNSMEQQQLQDMATRLDELCAEATRLNVSLLIDAEQAYYQPAIDYLALRMMARHNRSQPIVYNTYQMYRRDALDRLVADAEFFQSHPEQQPAFFFGVKLVRGAYLEAERQRAKTMNIPDPVHSTIQETHYAFNRAMEYVIEQRKHMAMVIATHNKDSIMLACDTIEAEGLKGNSNLACFAQLYGMGDYLSLELAQRGFSVCKYVPFGPIRDVMPYLSRRLAENRDVMSHTGYELSLIARELKRRAKARTRMLQSQQE